jgi:4-hydroxy-tetrahydrodipicolinate synthase
MIGVHICPGSYARLAKEFSNVVAVKVEGISTIHKIEEIRNFVGDELSIFGGMAAKNLLHELRLGAQGNIPSSSLPDLLVGTYEKFISGDTESANDAFRKYRLWSDFVSLHPHSFHAIERETLKLRGIIGSTTMRSPRVMLDEEGLAALKRILLDLKLISAKK